MDSRKEGIPEEKGGFNESTDKDPGNSQTRAFSLYFQV